MLQVVIPEGEWYNNNTQEFVKIERKNLQLEHSLVSLSKWESKWNKPFLGKDKKTIEEVIDYIRCMTLDKEEPLEVYKSMSDSVYTQIMEYINAPMTATRINDRSEKKNAEIITAEIIYYWMISQNIPMECQDWHLNKLLTLINVCGIKNSPPKKMSQKEMLARRNALNMARRSSLNSKG